MRSKDYGKGWEEGFTAGYRKALADRAATEIGAKTSSEEFLVTPEIEEEYPFLSLPMGRYVRLIRDLANNPIGYQELGHTER